MPRQSHHVPPTSLAAYERVRETLTKKRRSTLRLLEDYVRAHNNAPTYHELARWAKACSRIPAQIDDVEVAKVLQVIADDHNCAHRGADRVCAVTGNAAAVWYPGGVESWKPKKASPHVVVQRVLYPNGTVRWWARWSDVVEFTCSGASEHEAVGCLFMQTSRVKPHIERLADFTT